MTEEYQAKTKKIELLVLNYDQMTYAIDNRVLTLIYVDLHIKQRLY